MLKQLDNESLLEKYLYYQTLANNMYLTRHSDYYIKCILDRLDLVKKEVLNRMGGNK